MEYRTRNVGLPRVVNAKSMEADFTCNMDHCNRPIADGVGIFLCLRHLQKAWAAYQVTMGADVPESKFDPVVDKNAITTEGVVYVVRIGDLIKIGWTRNFKKRMYDLQPDAMLHFKQGTRKDEYKLQAKFLDHLAKGREWFDCNDETIAMVENLRSGKLAA